MFGDRDNRLFIWVLEVLMFLVYFILFHSILALPILICMQPQQLKTIQQLTFERKIIPLYICNPPRVLEPFLYPTCIWMSLYNFLCFPCKQASSRGREVLSQCSQQLGTRQGGEGGKGGAVTHVSPVECVFNRTGFVGEPGDSGSCCKRLNLNQQGSQPVNPAILTWSCVTHLNCLLSRSTLRRLVISIYDWGETGA